jgi:hypothetical protein
MPPSHGADRTPRSRRALRSAGVVERQLVEIKFPGFVRWTGLVFGNACGDTVTVSWGEAGGEHERDADRGWVLRHDRELLLKKTLSGEFRPSPRLITPRNKVTLVSGPPPGCCFTVPEMDFEHFDTLCQSHVDPWFFVATLKLLADPASLPQVSTLPRPLLYLVQLEHPDLAYRPRVASLGAVKIAHEVQSCVRPGFWPLELLLAVLVDLIGVQHRHLSAEVDGGVGWRQAFRVAEALVLLLSGHSGEPYGAARNWNDIISTDPSRSRSLVSCVVLAIGALFSACHSAAEIAALLSGSGQREAQASEAGWDRLGEFMALLCQDTYFPHGFETHVWTHVDTPAGYWEEVSLAVEETWEDLRWLHHMRALPRGLRRARVADPVGEMLRAAMLAIPPQALRGYGGAAVNAVVSDGTRDPALTTKEELICAATFHSFSHFEHGPGEMRELGRHFSRKLTDLLRRGDRDPSAFELVNNYDDLALLPSDDDDDDVYGDELDSPPPPKRARMTADVMARHEALIDPEIAARALHTAPRTRNLRNRSVTRRDAEGESSD